MEKSKALFLASMLAMAAILGGILLPAYTLDSEEGNDGLNKFEGPRRQPWLCDISNDQKGKIRQIIEAMKEDGASREEIREALNTKLKEWDIEVPEKIRPSPPPWMRDLTDEQREEIKQIIEDLKEDGASREEIREAVNAKLEEYGIDIPEFQGPKRNQLMSDLTEDQREDIRELAEKMKDEGASKEEIREAIRQLLEELE